MMLTRNYNICRRHPEKKLLSLGKWWDIVAPNFCEYVQGWLMCKCHIQELPLRLWTCWCGADESTSTQPSPNQVVDHNGFIIKNQQIPDSNVAPEPRAVLLRRQKEDQKQEIRLQKWRHMLGNCLSPGVAFRLTFSLEISNLICLLLLGPFSALDFSSISFWFLKPLNCGCVPWFGNNSLSVLSAIQDLDLRICITEISLPLPPLRPPFLHRPYFNRFRI